MNSNRKDNNQKTIAQFSKCSLFSIENNLFLFSSQLPTVLFDGEFTNLSE